MNIREWGEDLLGVAAWTTNLFLKMLIVLGILAVFLYAVYEVALLIGRG